MVGDEPGNEEDHEDLGMNWQIWGYLAKLPRGRTHGVTPSYLNLFPVRRRMYLVYRPRGLYLEAGVLFRNTKFERDVCITPHSTQFLYEKVRANYGCPPSRPSSGLICGPSTLYQYSY